MNFGFFAVFEFAVKRRSVRDNKIEPAKQVARIGGGRDRAVVLKIPKFVHPL